MSANREQLEVEEGTLRDAQRWSIGGGGGGEEKTTLQKKISRWACTFIQMMLTLNLLRRNVWYSHSAVHSFNGPTNQYHPLNDGWIYLAKSLLLELYYSRLVHLHTVFVQRSSARIRRWRRTRRILQRDRAPATELFNDKEPKKEMQKVNCNSGVNWTDDDRFSVGAV